MPHQALYWTPREIGFDLGVICNVPEEKEDKKALAEGRKVKERSKKRK